MNVVSNGARAARVIAFHLPQFYPIPENDIWWGKGFTEWTNVGKARRYFRGHYQPRVPADLGYYDMRVPETRAAQASMAREHGVEGFCYWHYWFAGERLLELPVNEILRTGEPDFPFCLAWANHSWTGVWMGEPKRVLKEQTYPGEDDHRKHFQAILPALLDRRYIRVDGKPLFVVFRPNDIPDLPRFTELWQKMAVSNGLLGLHLVGIWGDGIDLVQNAGFDGATLFRLMAVHIRKEWHWRVRMKNKIWKNPHLLSLTRMNRRPRYVYNYAEAMKYFIADEEIGLEYYPTVIPNFDNTPRSGVNGYVLYGSTPELFEKQCDRAVSRVAGYPESRRIVFVKSWNEWAEGNHLEPDLRFGMGYLRALKASVVK